MLDEFIYHTAGSDPVGRPFVVADPMYYDLDFFLWDVGAERAGARGDAVEGKPR
jgi:hypothetical protein